MSRPRAERGPLGGSAGRPAAGWRGLGLAALACAALAGAALGASTPAPRPASSADLDRADQLAREGKPAEAVGLYRLVGETGATRALRATGWLQAGRMVSDAATAETHFHRASELDPEGQAGAEALLELGRLYYARGAYAAADKALAASQLRLATTSYGPTVNLFRARVAMALHFPQAAAVAYQRLATTPGQTQRGLYGWAQALEAQRARPQALDLFDRYAASYPAGDYLAGALAGAARTGEGAGQADRAATSRARLSLV
ncbi:MAG TPA: hypothetical protein VMS93_05685, partial [Candidatus Saccharimonadales bacterium]|nr:hypothetical protein [Candidatus Saccharimonadales bacterium]